MELRYKVIDTNIFLLDPKKALFAFKPHRDDVKTVLIIPHTVIDELDNHKNERYHGRQTTRAANAQATLKLLDNYITRDPDHPKDPLKGVVIEDNYEFRYVAGANEKTSREVDKLLMKNHDSEIIKIALQLTRQNNCECELVSNDFGLRQRARLLGIKTNEWESITQVVDDSESEYEGYKGYRHLYLPKKFIEEQLALKQIALEDLSEFDVADLFPNEFLFIHEDADNDEDRNVVFATGFHDKNKGVVSLGDFRGLSSSGIKCRNYEQGFALCALTNKRIRLVHLVGPAGTGKTLIALAAGMEQLLSANYYESIRVVRPTISIGPELGYLPGTEREKLEPWMRAVYSNLHELTHNGVKGKKKLDGERFKQRDIEELIQAEKLLLTPLSPVRGDTFRRNYMILDEAQNLTPEEIKTLITRAGDHTKVVVTGDPWQIDHPHLRFEKNGLVHSIDCMRDLDYVATVYLCQGQRSQLATDASRRL